MNKAKLVSLIMILSLCACTNNSSSSNKESSIINSTSTNTSEVSSESSSSSSIPNIPTKNIVDVDVNDLEFELTEDESAYLITKYKKYDTYIRLPETYNGKNIIGIKEGAFRFSGVEDITLPDTYTEFDQLAFASCSSIKNYFVNDTHSKYKSVEGVLYSKDLSSLALYPLGRKDNYEVKDGTKKILKNAFNTANVIEVSIPESVEEIEEYAFYSAKRLKRINIPSKVKEIKESTFDTCSDLKYVTFSEGLEKTGYRAFWQCKNIIDLSFPSTLKIIGESSFEGCGGDKDVVLNEGLQEIGPFAFAYNEYIETITFPSTLKVIGEYAFMQNYMVKDLILNEGLEEIKEGAFFYNCNLRKIHLPSSLHTIGFNCFVSSEHNSPNGIEEITVSEDSEYFTIENKVLYSKDKKVLVYALISDAIEGGHFDVPSTVERIGDHAFYNVSSLRSISLPKSLKEIGKAPFYITSLNSISYEGTKEEFKLIKKEVEVFGSQTSSETLEVYWYYTNEGRGVNVVTCSDGELSTSEA